MSTAKPMETADRQARYVEQNGRLELTPRQQRQIRKTTLRLEHGRHRRPVNRPSGERAAKGRCSYPPSFIKLGMIMVGGGELPSC